jgi:hypothetical protein
MEQHSLHRPVIAPLIDNRKRVNKKEYGKLKGPDIPIEDLRRFAATRTPQRFERARQNRLKKLQEQQATATATTEPGSASPAHPVENALSTSGEKHISRPQIVEKSPRSDDQQYYFRDTRESREEQAVEEEATRKVSQPQLFVNTELKNIPTVMRHAGHGNTHFIIEEEGGSSGSAESNNNTQQ